VNLLSPALMIVAGLVLVAVLRPRQRRASVRADGGPGAELSFGQLLDVELPAGVAAEDVRVRLVRSGINVYTGSGEDIQLRAVWRWSWRRRDLVVHDRREPEWSPEWSRPIAERAWAMRAPAARPRWAERWARDGLIGAAVVLVAAFVVMGR
jgi:hypothetical protein